MSTNPAVEGGAFVDLSHGLSIVPLLDIKVAFHFLYFRIHSSACLNA